MPVFFSKIGSRCLKRPDCSVDVVEATVMNRCAAAGAASASVKHVNIAGRRHRASLMATLLV
jgi:hypothetical protein